jgi:hypothetical protein
MSVNFQLVKMDGDWVQRPPWYRVDLWVKYRLQGKNIMPREPRNHPACQEILEAVGDQPARVVFRR